ncbi:MAG: ParA family protein [Cyclobacteriaceae bacterium]
MSNNIAVYNFKGGVGKTTTTLNVGYSWSKNFKVLLIDCDPQCNLTNVASQGQYTSTLYDQTKSLLHGQTPDIVPVEITPYLHLIPGDYRMAELESNSHYINFGSEINRKFLSHLGPLYDLVILDCPTHFGVFVKALLDNIDGILIPTVPDNFSITGVQTLLQYLSTLNSFRSINILGIFFNMYRKSIIQNGRVMRDSKELFGNLILKTTIGSSTRVREANNHGISVLDYEPDCSVSKDFDNLCDELISKLFEKKTLDSVMDLDKIKA